MTGKRKRGGRKWGKGGRTVGWASVGASILAAVVADARKPDGLIRNLISFGRSKLKAIGTLPREQVIDAEEIEVIDENPSDPKLITENNNDRKEE